MHYRIAGIILAGAMVGVLTSCGGGASGKRNKAESQLNVLVGERLGALIAQDSEAGGTVVLVHMSRTPGVAAAWINGLRSGLGGAQVVELGPEQLPVEAKMSMGGFPALRYALQQHPDATAIVTSLPVGAHEKPSFPANHPPIYALGWSYLPDSVFLFQSKHLVGGVFEKMQLGPAGEQASPSPEDLFDRTYVVVTAETLRQELGY